MMRESRYQTSLLQCLNGLAQKQASLPNLPINPAACHEKPVINVIRLHVGTYNEQ